MSPTLCIAIHDAAPATWTHCRVLFDLLDDLGAPPATLLVVPEYHRRGSIAADSAFVSAIDRRIARGDEIVLHGYYHLDDGPVPRTPLEWLRRRHLTASEGEFAALSQHEAAARIDAGLRLFDRFGWNVRGFVAPAWLLGTGARAALKHTSMRYTSTHTPLEMPTEGRSVAAPVISASTRSTWRRWTSRRWLRAAHRLTRNAPLLRIALHPADASHPQMLAAWRALLRKLLTERVPLTKSAALGFA